MNKTNQALQLAIKCHKNEFRKGNKNLPFVIHPISVAFLLHSFGYQGDILIAAFLHDTLEHKNLSFEKIKKQFGKKIAEIVQTVTAPESKDWFKSKRKYIFNLSNTSHEVKALALADKIVNLMDTYHYLINGKNIWKVFTTGEKGQKWFHKELLSALHLKKNALYDEYVKWYKKIFK